MLRSLHMLVLALATTLGLASSATAITAETALRANRESATHRITDFGSQASEAHQQTALGYGENASDSSLASGGAAEATQAWKLGEFKSAAKWESQLAKRGWTPQQITEAIEKGERFAAENLVNKGNAATRYVHPETGQSVVLDEVTKEVIHVGGPGFKY